MSSSIVITLPKLEDAKKIRTILERHGFAVASVCNSASNALAAVSQLDGGLLISSARLPDMNYVEVREYLPQSFELLILASERILSEIPESFLTLQMPMKASDLVNTVNMVLSQLDRRRRREKKKPKPRTWKEQNYISNAKMLLMQRNHLSEEEAYRYIQKCSMDSGTNMVETAQMVLMLLYDEV